jgi:hypothetical protein
MLFDYFFLGIFETPKKVKRDFKTPYSNIAYHVGEGEIWWQIVIS